MAAQGDIANTRGHSVSDDWYTTAFDALYPVVYAHRTVEAAVPEAAFAARALGLREGDCALDLCCGTGRHMVHLQKVCARVYGLDYSEALLEMGRSQLGLDGKLLRGDMRHLPFANACLDAVMNFFTSFGYFEEEVDNRLVLSEIARILKPGGRFMLDYFNVPYLRQNLEAESERRNGEYRIIERRWIDDAAGRVNKFTRVYQGESTFFETGESVRLYSQEVLLELLSAAGLRADALHGDFDGRDATPDAPRLILTGHKD